MHLFLGVCYLQTRLNLWTECSWFVWEEEQAAAWPWWLKASSHGLGPIKMLHSLADWGSEGQVWLWGTAGFCISLFPWREQHSKLSGSLWAAGGTGSWAVLWGPSNCLIAGQAVEMVRKLSNTSSVWKPETERNSEIIYSKQSYLRVSSFRD